MRYIIIEEKWSYMSSLMTTLTTINFNVQAVSAWVSLEKDGKCKHTQIIFLELMEMPCLGVKQGLCGSQACGYAGNPGSFKYV